MINSFLNTINYAELDLELVMKLIVIVIASVASAHVPLPVATIVKSNVPLQYHSRQEYSQHLQCLY